MNNEEIDKIIQEMEKLKTPESEGLEIPPCGWRFNNKGSTFRSAAPTDDLKYGFKRTTEEASKLAAKLMIRVNRLSLLAHILDVECEFVSGEDNYYVFQNADQMLWKTNYSINLFYPDRVYMTEEGAEKVREILNNGEWKLELEE